MRFTEACCLYGLSPYECGLLLSALKKSEGLSFNYPQLKGADEAEIVRIISLIGQKKGIGEVVSKRFERELFVSSTPQLIDPRGAGIQAIFDIHGEGETAYCDLLLGLTKKYDPYILGYISGYLRVYTHAFMNIGVPHLYSIPLIFEKLFKRAPNNLSIIRYKLRHIKFLGFKCEELLKKGLSSAVFYDEKRGSLGSISKIFTDEVRDDGSILNLTRLNLGYELAIKEIKGIN